MKEYNYKLPRPFRVRLSSLEDCIRLLNKFALKVNSLPWRGVPGWRVGCHCSTVFAAEEGTWVMELVPYHFPHAEILVGDEVHVFAEAWDFGFLDKFPQVPYLIPQLEKRAVYKLDNMDVKTFHGQYAGRLNATEWEGYAPRTVLMMANGELKPDGYWRVEVTPARVNANVDALPFYHEDQQQNAFRPLELYPAADFNELADLVCCKEVTDEQTETSGGDGVQ